ncbi:MAG: PHP domain-containing protein [Treponema sp.]|jgi:predicted metal-dependent phosphoesterase TrpH|nr:PHP domain-containing protein [Treponema sp.]
MGFLYETHLHTSQSSACGESPGRDYIQRYIDHGFTGIMVTDHFFNSNCSADRTLPWSEWVKRYCEGYEDARNEGEKRGLDVFFGWEETFDGDDFMIYGLDRAWLLEHPEVVRWNREELFRETRRGGGCVIQAHPFRQHHYIRTVHLAPFLIDAVEAANRGNHDAWYDSMAAEYARILKLPLVAGSDIHLASDLDDGGPYGIELEEKCSSIKDFVDLILRRGRIDLRIPAGRCDLSGEDRSRPFKLKVDLRDRRNRTFGAPRIMNFNELAAELRETEN